MRSASIYHQIEGGGGKPLRARFRDQHGLAEGHGQAAPDVGFVVRQSGYLAQLSATRVALAARGLDEPTGLELVGASRSAAIRGVLPTGGTSHYLRAERPVTGPFFCG